MEKINRTAPFGISLREYLSEKRNRSNRSSGLARSTSLLNNVGLFWKSELRDTITKTNEKRSKSKGYSRSGQMITKPFVTGRLPWYPRQL
jgi:hypothetical protein